MVGCVEKWDVRWSKMRWFLQICKAFRTEQGILNVLESDGGDSRKNESSGLWPDEAKAKTWDAPH